MFRRNAERRVLEACQDTPVVLVHGARQVGKSTLVQSMPGRTYLTLDDPLVLDAAKRNPDGFLAAQRGLLTLDEVQRAPELFRAIKALVDRDREPGRFLLTGSANVLSLPRLSDSLAGRMEVVELWPLSRAEMSGYEPTFLDRMLAGELPEPGAEEPQASRLGGYPEVVRRSTPARRKAWFDAYLRTLVERDIRDLAQIEGLSSLPRLLKALAKRMGEPQNVSALARDAGTPHSTLTRYLALLEAAFILRPIPAWTAGKAMRSPRVAFADTGLAYSLAEVEPLAAMENFIAMEWVKTAEPLGWRVMHFRSVRGHSVPLLAESPDGRLVAAVVTTEPAPGPEHTRGLELLAEIAGSDYAGGAVLHAGDAMTRVHAKLIVAPMASAWS